jgi:hypothetical protein
MVRNFRTIVCAAQVLVLLQYCLPLSVQAKGLQAGPHFLPPGWGDSTHGTLSDEDHRAGFDNSNRVNNHPSVFIEIFKSNPTDYHAIQQTIGSVYYRGKRVKFSGFLKTENVMDWAALTMKVADDRGPEYKIVGFDNMEDRPVNGNTDWKEYQVVLDIPEKSTELTFGFMLAGKGKVWGGDFSLTPVGKDVALTGKPSAALAYLNAKKKPFVDAPQNLDLSMSKNGTLEGWGLETRCNRKEDGDDPVHFEFDLDKNVHFQNQPTMFLKSALPDQGGAGICSNWFTVTAHSKFRGKRVKYSGSLKTENVKDRAGLSVRVMNQDKTLIIDDDMKDRPISGNTDWKKYETVFDIPQEAESVRLGVYLHRGGEVWVSGLKFEIVGDNVALTVKPVPAPERLHIVPDPDPLNLKFEQAPAKEDK